MSKTILSTEDKIMKKLLEQFDWDIRCVDENRDDYACGYADADMQAILNIGEILGEKIGGPYIYEAYKRVAQFESAEQYIRDYPKPISKLQAAKR